MKLSQKSKTAFSMALLLIATAVLGGCVGEPGKNPDRTAVQAPGKWSMSSAPTPSLVQTLGDPSTSGLTEWPGQFDNAAKAFDVDGDGIDEIIAHSSDTHVYVFNAANGHVLAKLPTTYPAAWHIERVLNGVQAGILIPGDPASLVITNHAAYVAVWTFEQDKSTDERFVFQKEWEHRMDGCHRSPSMDAEAALGDLDGDGTLEIAVHTEEIGFFALNNDGTIRWSKCWSGGNSAPVIDDLNGDGRAEVVLAADSGRISVLDGDTGQPRWAFNAADALYGISPASVPVSPTVAEIDGIPPKEILFTARMAPDEDPLRFPTFHMAIFAIHQNASTYQAELLWMRQPVWANPLSNTKLVVHDVDGDGASDIFGMDWNTIGHRPGDWERLGPAHVFRLDRHGEDVWVREIDAWWSNQDILVADSDGDGEVDVLVNGPGEGGDGLWRLSSASGAAQGFLGLSPWKMLRGPVVGEGRVEGSLQLLVPVTPLEGNVGRGAILVFELDAAARTL